MLLGSCSSNPPATLDCSGQPDFVVTVAALAAPLPDDTVLRVAYGGGQEEYRLADPGQQQVLFCMVSDRAGNPGEPLPMGGDAGDTGAAGAPGDVEALRCTLWTDGPAQVEVESAEYPETEPLDLVPRRGQCTVTETIELSMPDGGV